MNQLAQVKICADRLESAMRQFNFESLDYWANSLHNEIIKVVANLNDLPIINFAAFTTQIRYLTIIPYGLEEFSQLINRGKFDSPTRLWQLASVVMSNLETMKGMAA